MVEAEGRGARTPLGERSARRAAVAVLLPRLSPPGFRPAGGNPSSQSQDGPIKKKVKGVRFAPPDPQVEGMP